MGEGVGDSWVRCLLAAGSEPFVQGLHGCLSAFWMVTRKALSSIVRGCVTCCSVRFRRGFGIEDGVARF